MNRPSEILALDPTTLSRNLRRLERDGLIRIRPAPDDRRVMLVSLTPEGEQPIADAFPLWTRAQERVAEAPGPEFTASLLDDFEAVMAADPFDPAHDGSC
jgi:DNA-binding MarR family transcriptional regulator